MDHLKDQRHHTDGSIGERQIRQETEILTDLPMALSETRMGCCAESSRGGGISYNGDETSAERGTLVAAILTKFDHNWYYIEPSSNLCLIPERGAYHISSWLRNPQVFLCIEDKCTALA